MAELSKAYDAQAVEPKWYAHWLKEGFFTANPASPKPAFSIVIPPPNITGVLTLGHVLNNTIQDILARHARMQGKEVLWLPGMDHAGIGTQTAVEKWLRKNEGVTRRDLGREKFLERVLEWQDKHGGIIIEQLKRLGCSCDWSRQRYTFDAQYVRVVQEVFVDLYNKGLIYRGRRMINWDPAAQTALSDEEVVATPTKSALYYVRYELVDDPGRYLEVATTRPETIMADVALAVHPEDPRYRDSLGKKVWRPLDRAQIPVISDAAIDPQFGTGVLKVTPAHDRVDFEIGARHGLPVIDVLTPDGRIDCPGLPELNGLDRFAAREKAATVLEELGLLAKTEPHESSVGYSDRSQVPIEPRLSEQWFLRYPKTEEALRVVREHLVRFFPAHWEKVYAQWLEKIQDWCISRQVWWGHRIPAWYRGASLQLASSEKAQVTNLRHEETQVTNLRHEATQVVSLRQEGFRGFDEFAEVDITRRRLPHWRQEGATYFVTFRLADSIPADKLVGLEEERERWLSTHPEPWNEQEKRAYYERFSVPIERWLDAGYGSCLLRQPETAQLMADALKHFAGERYKLGAWVVMPNHVHVVVTPQTGHELTEILHSWKRFSARAINRLLGKEGQLWQHESYDHIVRDEASLGRITEYIEHNPEFAGIRVSQVSCVGQVCKLRRGQVENLPHVRVQIESPGEGWVQDEDTLDTWFSSWLWAYETMDPITRSKFYPTNVLVTAPDIIFFWVARMIIAGLEFKPGKTARDEDNIPFHDVFFTGLIRDAKGRKMSKSLGNSPDPLDLIAKYGADGLRFGLMRIAPSGQDIRFDEKQIEEGRNFANKLWNAVRYRQMQGGETEGEIEPARLTSDDKWILLRLDEAIRAVTQALNDYHFNEAAQALYRFFWSEFCDWYLEASKASGNDPAQKATSLAVIDFVLGHVLRMLHPFMPFITEELWHGLGFNADLPKGQGNDTIQFARWPQPLDEDFKRFYGLTPNDERFANEKYETVTAGRRLRRDFNIASNKRITFVLVASRELPEKEAAVVQLLLNAERLERPEKYEPPKGTPTALTPLGELYLPLQGLIDIEAERARLEKEIAKTEAELMTVRKKLANENFIGNAPIAVVEEHRERERNFAERLEQLQRMRESLG